MHVVRKTGATLRGEAHCVASSDAELLVTLVVSREQVRGNLEALEDAWKEACTPL